jgi:hypothetical protein
MHRNLKLHFINGKPTRSVEHLVSLTKPAIFKALIESKLDFFDRVSGGIFSSSLHIWKRWLYSTTTTVMWWIIRRRETLARRIWPKIEMLAAEVLDTTLEEGYLELAATRRLTVFERSPAIKCHRTRIILTISLLGSLRLVLTQISLRAICMIFPAVFTPVRTDQLLCWLSTRRREILTRSRQN